MNLNIMLIIVLVAFALKMRNGFKKGMVKEIISVISLIVLCGVLTFVAFGIRSYLNGAFLGVAAATVLLLVLVLAHRLINIMAAPIKLLSKLPIVRMADKLLGIIFGVIEVLFGLWTLYTLIMLLEMGMIEEAILSHTRDSAFLTWMYQNNYLAAWVEGVVGDFIISL